MRRAWVSLLVGHSPSELFGREVLVTWVPTGTAANVAAIGSLLTGPGGCVLVAADAHVLLDEAGAVERAWGVPLVPVPSRTDKLTVADVAAVLERLTGNQPFSPTPSVLSLTQLSETGQRFTMAELAAFAELATDHGLKLHLDGARFANALAADPDMARVFDINITTLAFGGTKNGQGPVEAVVTTDPSTHRLIGRAAKQLGYTQSKMRFSTGGIGASIRSGEFLQNAQTANTRAAELGHLLTQAGLPPVFPVEGNLVFVRLPAELVDVLDAWCHLSHWDGDGLVRLACSWDHTVSDVTALTEGIDQLLDRGGPRPRG